MIPTIVRPLLMKSDKIEFLCQRKFPRYEDYIEDIATKYANLQGDDIDLKQDQTLDDIAHELFTHHDISISNLLAEQAESTDVNSQWSTEHVLHSWARDKLRGYLNDARNYQDALYEMTESDLTELYYDEFEKYNRECFEAEHIKDAKEPFNQKFAKADYDYWLSLDAWSIDDCVALSLGKNPNIVNTGSLFPDRREKRSPFRIEYRRRHDRIERALRVNRLRNPIIPAQFVEWAVTTKFDIPTALIADFPEIANLEFANTKIKSSGAATRKLSNASMILGTLLIQTNLYSEDLEKDFTKSDPLVKAILDTMSQKFHKEYTPETIKKHLNDAVNEMRSIKNRHKVRASGSR